MPLADLKSKYKESDLWRSPPKNEWKIIVNEYLGPSHNLHSNYFFGFLGLIYDGVNTLKVLKSQMRLFFISSTKQLVIEEPDVEEYLQVAKKKNLISTNQDGKITLTKEGKKFTELCYYWNLHTSYWMGKFFSKYSVMAITGFFLILLSSLKIFTGFQLGSQGMLSEGFENLTDLIKIGVIGLIGFKYKKDKIASVIITIMMLFAGASLMWSNIDTLLNPSIIIPSIQAYIIGFFSIALNAGLMELKGIVGRISGNLSLLSDSRDSELNIKISIGVLIGLTFAIFKYYFVDAIIGIIIAFLILKEGIEIITELISKDEEFNISDFKVVADHIYANRLTEYILASIRREIITPEQLLENFEKGLELGRLYYQGFADFFYNELGEGIAKKYLKKLIETKNIEILNEYLTLTPKGIKQFYKAKAEEYKSRSKMVYQGKKIGKSPLYCLLFIIAFILLIFYANDINIWLNNF